MVKSRVLWAIWLLFTVCFCIMAGGTAGYLLIADVYKRQEMSYAQRWSSGVQIDIPAYTFVPVDPSGKGDLNGDGKITNLDVSILLDAVTAGRPLSPDIADMNNDGKVTNVDVSALLDLVTKGS